MTHLFKYLALITLFIPYVSLAQELDTLEVDTATIKDSEISIKKKDTIKSKPLDKLIEYEAKDSLQFFLDSLIAYMYTQVNLKSEDMELKAGKVRIDINKNELEAYITYDSLGRIKEKPKLFSKDDNFTAYYMKYNFKTRKGYATNVKTEQPEGYLHGSKVKIFPNGETNILQGKFTTCNLDHPHYYINLSRAKYIPNKSIITGPFYFIIEDIPFPIGLPFGYFPQRKYNSSGIVQPQIFQEKERGIGFINGGYYLVINDRADFEVLADIFSKGSWGVKTRLRINDRYKYFTNFSFNYTHRATGERILLDSRRENLYNIIFTYRQKPKANPTFNFSANVNFSKGNYEQYNAVNIQQFVKNTSRSSLNFTKNFLGTPFRLILNASVTQNFADSTIDINAPQLSFTMNRIQPFKKFFSPSSKSWFKDLSVSMRADLKNKIPRFADSLLFYKPDTLKYMMQNGFKYSLPVNLKPLRLFHYINVSPSFNYVGYVYFSYINKYLMNDSTVIIDTIFKPRHIFEYRFGLNFSTNLYGLFRVNAFGIKAIRHKLTPNIGFTYRPDFGDPKFGIYKPEPDDTTGTRYYNIFYIRPLGTPGMGLQKSINFGLRNNFEMKIRKHEGDTVIDKKVKLIENLSLTGSYNFAADTLQLSIIRLNANTRLGQRTSLSFNASFDPYTINENGQRINVFEYQVSGKPLRLTNMGFQTRLSLSSDDFNKSNKRQKDKDSDKEKEQYIPYNYFDPNWNLSVDYRFNLRSVYDYNTQSSLIKITQILNLNFVMSPTPYWNFSLFTGYDFDKRSLVLPVFQIYRDLHCWEMLLQVIPSGRMKSYLFTVRIKSPMFRFFEFKRQRSWHDNFI